MLLIHHRRSHSSSSCIATIYSFLQRITRTAKKIQQNKRMTPDNRTIKWNKAKTNKKKGSSTVSLHIVAYSKYTSMFVNVHRLTAHTPTHKIQLKRKCVGFAQVNRSFPLRMKKTGSRAPVPPIPSLRIDINFERAVEK